MSSDPILVTGATGTHGGAVVQALLGAGHRVQALTRDPGSSRARQLASIGAEPVRGDLLDPESLATAMDGIAAVYGVTTPFGDAGPEQEVEQGRQLIAAARRSGLGPTPAAMASAIADAGGRQVSYRELPISEVAARSADIAAMYRFLAAVGYQADSAGLRARFPELSLTTFRGWVEAQFRG